jgi:hypothetical protein
MRRREFIAGLVGTPARPGIARAQQTDRMRRIGVLMKLAEDNPQSRALGRRIYRSAHVTVRRTPRVLRYDRDLH